MPDPAAGLDEIEIRIELQKDEAKREVYGWGNVFRRRDGEIVKDSFGHIIDTEEAMEAAEDAFHRYMIESRSADDQHQSFGVASLIEGMVFTPRKLRIMGAEPDALQLGIWVAYKVWDDEAWKRIEEGKRTMLSIVGKGRIEKP